MNRTLFSLVLVIVLLPAAVDAQTTAGSPSLKPPARNPPIAVQDPAIYISAADITQRMAMAHAMETAGVPDTGPYSLMKQPPFVVTMEYRLSPEKHWSVHQINSEMFVVIDGSATMTVGGKLIDPHRQGEHDLSGSGIEGGTHYKLHKGDILLVPPNTAHSVSQVDGKFAAISVHIPLGSADLWPQNTRQYITPVPPATPK